MARIILNCYEFKNGKISKLVYEKLFEQYGKEVFPGATSLKEGYTFWNKFKDTIVNQSPGAKKKDDIGYVSQKCKNGNILIFAIGTGKTGTLKAIFEEEMSGETTSAPVQEAPKQEPVQKEEKPVKEEKVEATKASNDWDLSDTNIPVSTHAEEILKGEKKIVGKFNEAQSKEVIKLLGEADVENIINDTKEYNGLTKALAQNLKKYGPVLNYTIYDKVKIAELVKNLAEQVKDPDFEQMLSEANSEEFDFSTIVR